VHYLQASLKAHYKLWSHISIAIAVLVPIGPLPL